MKNLETSGSVDRFETRDFCFAATLLALSEPLDRLEWEGRKAAFCFDISRERAGEVSRNYANGRLKVAPRALFSALDELRRLLRDHKHE